MRITGSRRLKKARGSARFLCVSGGGMVCPAAVFCCPEGRLQEAMQNGTNQYISFNLCL